jgi:23S rRNA G2445 N2-methylase RlmL
LLNLISLFHNSTTGLEFIAAKDIEESLDNDTLLQNTKYSWEKKTGRVHLFCSVSSLNLFRDYIMNQVTLLCIYSVTLVASESIIPADIFSDVQPTYDYIMEQTRRAPWNTVIDEDPKDSNEDKKSFRATFRKEQIKHKAKSQEIAGYIGSAFNDFYSYWKVKMTDYTYEIMSIWFQSTDTGVLSRVEGREESIILLLGVTIPLKDQRQRNRVFVGRTSLNPCIAYCLAKLADPKPGQVIFDMCCGTGTIPIEGKRI